jgi:hypothetical protein
VDAPVLVRLKVVRWRNWKGELGWYWRCDEHDRLIHGFTADSTWTSRHWRPNGAQPPAQSRAMDGARRHLYRYHRED